MALSNRRQEVLFSQHGEDVSLGVSATHVGTPYNGGGSLQDFFGVSLTKLDTNEAYTTGHGRDIFGLQPRLVRAECAMGETPQLAATFIN